MATSPSGRAQAIYNAAEASNPNFSKLSAGEQAAFLSALTMVFGASGGSDGDLQYLLNHVDVLPVALSGLPLNNPIGQVVLIPSTAAPGLPSTGATSALSDITGKGSIT